MAKEKLEIYECVRLFEVDPSLAGDSTSLSKDAECMFSLNISEGKVEIGSFLSPYSILFLQSSLFFAGHLRPG